MQATALTIVHKLLRKQMFDFSTLLFRAGPSDAEEIRRSFDQLEEFIRQHAAHEDDLFGPIIQQADAAVSAKMKAEHGEQDEMLDKVRVLVDALVSRAEEDPGLFDQLRLDWNRFVGEMLLHLDREETIWSEAMQGAMEGVGALGVVAATQPAGARQAFLEGLWTVTTPKERAEIERACEGELRRIG